MRLSRTQRLNMKNHQNIPTPTPEKRDADRKKRKCRSRIKLVFRHIPRQKVPSMKVKVPSNRFTMDGFSIDGFFCVYDRKENVLEEIGLCCRKYRTKRSAQQFTTKANLKPVWSTT